MKVEIKFCSMWNFAPQAASLAEKIASEHRKKITALTLVPDSGGCFEVTVDDKLIYSKLETKEFPSEDAIVKELGEMLS